MGSTPATPGPVIHCVRHEEGSLPLAQRVRRLRVARGELSAAPAPVHCPGRSALGSALTNAGENLGPAILRFGLAACVPLFCSPFPEGFFVVSEVAEFGVWASVPEIGFIDLIGIVVLLPWLIVVCWSGATL